MAQLAYQSDTPHPSTSTVPAVRLSDRESEILQLIVQGQMNHEIAESLFLTINTVKTHIRTLYRKLGVSSRSHAIIWAAQHGLLDAAPPGGTPDLKSVPPVPTSK